ncbi:unnamed protein product [Soboliphyme baturini]|uniref:UBR-type domain-containing protein n=1 Tax=Soboliphyme baturini TaxID=241478 RepID=A0A183IPZ4_9BILA|nr:unnamed protein product [Soboliphyme baturini]
MLLLLFHSLPLLQKKECLLSTAESVIKFCSVGAHKNAECCTSAYFGRVLVILDYIIRNFYEPSSSLVEQLQTNIFAFSKIANDSAPTDGAASPSTTQSTSHHEKLFYSCPTLDTYFRQLNTQSQMCVITPCFYYLCQPPSLLCGVPKIDGLAASFIQNSFSYRHLYSCFMELMYSCFQIDRYENSDSLQRCCRYFNGTMLWRLLGIFPPSAAFLRKFLTSGPSDMTFSEVLMVVRIGMRLFDPAFTAWIREGLNKQHVASAEYQSLINDVGQLVASAEYLVTMIHYAVSFKAIIIAKLIGIFFEYHLNDGLLMALTDLTTSLMSSLVLCLKKLLIVHSCPAMDADASTTNLLLAMLSMVSSVASNVRLLHETAWPHIPLSLRSAILGVNLFDLNAVFPVASSWKSDSSKDGIPAEGYLSEVVTAHLTCLVMKSDEAIFYSMKHAIMSTFYMLSELIRLVPSDEMKLKLQTALLDLIFDSTTAFLSDQAAYELSVLRLTMEDTTSSVDVQNAYVFRMTYQCLEKFKLCPKKDSFRGFSLVVYAIRSGCLSSKRKVSLQSMLVAEVEELMISLLSFVEASLTSLREQTAVVSMFNQDGVGSLILIKDFSTVSSCYISAMVSFCTAAFKAANASFSIELMQFAMKLFTELLSDPGYLKALLRQLLITGTHNPSQLSFYMEECLRFLKSLALVLQISHYSEAASVSVLIVRILIRLLDDMLLNPSESYFTFKGSSGNGGAPNSRVSITDWLLVVSEFASMATGEGHLVMLRALCSKLKKYCAYLTTAEVLGKIRVSKLDENHMVMIDAVAFILSYVTRLFILVNKISPVTKLETIGFSESGSSSEDELDVASEGFAVADDEDSGDESQEDSLDSKLCTFTITQKEFMNQHWYYCHTCNMTDGEGVCTICAKVCHCGHDLSYAKFGSFFCDCGAKEDNSCLALVKRIHSKRKSECSQKSSRSSKSRSSAHPSSSDMEAMSQVMAAERKVTVFKEMVIPDFDLSAYGSSLMDELNANRQLIAENTLLLLKDALPVTMVADLEHTAARNVVRLKTAFQQMHTTEKSFEMTSNLATIAMGSSDGVFENVRFSHSGEQGQTIKQLFSSNVLDRSCMCCLVGTYQKKQYLAVTHDRVKVRLD